MNVFITGGAGFIGSHMAERLLPDGHCVDIIDDLSTGSTSNIEHLKTYARFRYAIDSISNVGLVSEFTDRADIVIHLAAAVGVRLIIESPVRTIETNIRGTEVVLQAASKKRKKVFIASTSEVYGKSTEYPFDEDGDLLLGPTTKSRWSYACSKAIDEFLALAYYKESRVPVVIGRFFNTVGPRQTGRYGMVIPTLVKQALLNRPITVYGDGSQSRTFAYVNDVVEAVIRLVSEDKAVGNVFNIGSTQEISIDHLARLIRERAQSNSAIVYVPYDRAYEEGFEDTTRRIPDVRKLERTIGFRPVTPIEDIVDAVIGYFKDNQSAL